MSEDKKRIKELEIALETLVLFSKRTATNAVALNNAITTLKKGDTNAKPN